MHDSILPPVGAELLATVVIVVAVIVANVAISTVLRSRSWLSRETKLRGSVFWRNFSLLLALLALLFVWRAELRAAALSLAALSVALVLAGKELFTSILGYVHRTTTGTFRFGDVIEINGVRGEVIDQTLLSTTMLEMSEEHQFTGRLVQFPNSFFVLHPVRNFSSLGNYQLGILAVPLAAPAEVERAKATLESVAREVCSEYIAPTGRALRALEGEQFIVMPSAEPRVTVRLPDAGKIVLALRFPCPSDQRTRTEQEILVRYLAASAAFEPTPGSS
ncbi:MAG: mechanosensitive ion channel [Burkholderiales bacterium]|nr:mechanosensitive ion channel [Burkholderiales bacterium]